MSSAEAPLEKNRFRRHRRKTIFLLLFVFAALFDTVGASVFDLARERAERRRQEEAAERDRQKIDTDSDEKLYRCYPERYHHDLSPNASVERALWAGRYYPVRTNSLGFRDRRVRDVPLAQHPRLLLIGDSFTEGVGLRYEDTFAARVEDDLSKDGISVLNAGVASYSPSIYYRKVAYLLDEKKLEVDTLAVFLDLSDIHDEAVWYADVFWKDENRATAPTNREAVAGVTSRDVAQDVAAVALPAPAALPSEDPDLARLTTYERVTRFLWRHSLLARGVVKLKLAVIGGVPPERAVGATHSPRSRWTVDRALFEEYGRTGLRRCALEMDKLAELCRARKIELVLVVYPWPDQIDTRDLDSIHVRFWRDWSERQHVAFFDLFPVFINQENKCDVYDRYFIPADAHWNAAGHELVANAFLERFRALHKK